jgi:Ycf66 protein N-terminus
MPPSLTALVALLLKRSFRKFPVMLAYILSVVVGTGSVALYLSAFLFPEIHRQKDIFWSGLGLFYALALWVNGQNLSGGMLLAQALSVILLGWFIWETLSLRREIIPANQRTPIPPTPNLNLSGLRRDNLKSNPPSPTEVIDALSAIANDLETPDLEDAVAINQPWIEIRQEFPRVSGSNPAPPQPPSE